MNPEEEKRIARLVAVAVKNALIDAQGLSRHQAADVALAAAKEAVRQQHEHFFAMLGVNIADAKQVAGFASDMEFLRSMHSGASAMGRRTAIFVLTAFLGGMVLAVTAGVKVLLGGHAGH
jgi:hypothetical protein